MIFSKDGLTLVGTLQGHTMKVNFKFSYYIDKNLSFREVRESEMSITLTYGSPWCLEKP